MDSQHPMQPQGMDIEEDKRQPRITQFFNPIQQVNRPTLNLFSNPVQQNRSPSPPPRTYQFDLFQMQYRNFGKKAFDKVDDDYSSKNFGQKWRMEATQNQYGGSGKDEKTSTATAREFLKKINDNPNLFNFQKQDVASTLSMNRIATDALVWEKDGEYHGHPGALRVEPNTTKWASKGHGSRDRSRARTAQAEFDSLNTDFQKTNDFSKVKEAVWLANIRTSAETIRTMSMPYEQFVDIGRLKKSVFHSKFGDISERDNIKKMARYVHNARETEKWHTASQMNLMGLHQHVPDVMQEYLIKHKNDHHAAMRDFHEMTNNGNETRINTAKSSQAHQIDSNETLKGTAGRKRALSDARKFKS